MNIQLLQTAALFGGCALIPAAMAARLQRHSEPTTDSMVQSVRSTKIGISAAIAGLLAINAVGMGIEGLRQPEQTKVVMSFTHGFGVALENPERPPLVLRSIHQANYE